jgi:UDP-N-acetylglucosamine:LPS N-acetylglucosamine transferase
MCNSVIEQDNSINGLTADKSVTEITQKPDEGQFKITFVLVSGGHCTELLNVAERFRIETKKSYIIFKGDKISKSKIKHDADIIEVTKSFQEVLRHNPLKLLLLTPAFGFAIFQGMRAMLMLGIDAVVSNGSGPAIPIMIAAKLTGRKVIYIESMARIFSRSLTGALAYHFLADLFFVQWPEQKLLYPDAIYKGRVL